MSTDECVAPAIVCADVDRTEWRAFVDAEPAANVFHTPEMAAVFAGTPGHQVSPWAACSDSGAILALIVPVHVTLAAGPLRRWTSRAVAYGGVARAEGASGTAAAARLVHEYGRRAHPDLLFTELRHQDDASGPPAALETSGFVHEPHLNYLVALERSEADLWSSLSRSADNACAAEKKGIKVVEAEDDATVDARTGSGRRVPPRTRAARQSDDVPLAAAPRTRPRGMRESSPGSSTSVSSRRSCCSYVADVDWYAGSDRSFASYSPTEHLVWDVLRWGARTRLRGVRLTRWEPGGLTSRMRAASSRRSSAASSWASDVTSSCTHLVVCA
jgi:hypothetical protein